MDTRGRIVEAADRLFYERGIQQVGMDQIREAAGLSLKRLYTEFEGKDAIVLAVLSFRHDMWVAGIEKAAAPRSDPRDRLLAVFDFLAEWFVSDTFRGCAFINAFGELGGTSSPVADAARRHKESFHRYIDELVRQAGGAPDLAMHLVLLAEGAQTTSAITHNADVALQARSAAATLIAAAVDGRRPLG